MVVLDFSIVNVALPSIQRELGFAASAAQWVVTGYAITFGGLLILGGRAADLFGRRRMFVTGLIAFSAASLAAGWPRTRSCWSPRGRCRAWARPWSPRRPCPSSPPASRRDPTRTRALGLYGATASVGFVAGQVLGGFLVEFTSWRAVFLVNVPVGLAAVLLTPRLLGRGREQRARRRLDVPGALLITLAVASVVFAVSQGGAAGWTSPLVLGAAGVAVAALAGFAAAEGHQPDPLVRGDLLRLGSLRKGGALIMLLGVWNGGEMLVLSLYFQQVLHDSPLMTGLAIAPQGVVGFTAGLTGARLAARLGLQRLLVLTNAVATAGFLVLTHLPATGGYSPLLAAVTFVGFGTAGTAFGAMVTASRGVADGDQGFVGGVINTSRQIGAGIGAALLPAIALTASHGGRMAGVGGDRAAMLAGAVVAGLATLIALAHRRKSRTPAGCCP